MKLPRHGIVEIETLRRFGKVPIGTRAVGEFAIWEEPDGVSALDDVLQARIPLGDDPRIVAFALYSDFTSDTKWPRSGQRSYRGKTAMFHVANIDEYLFMQVIDQLEGESTSTGAQRFRVVRIEWRDDDPLPAWVAKQIEAFERRRAKKMSRNA